MLISSVRHLPFCVSGSVLQGLLWYDVEVYPARNLERLPSFSIILLEWDMRFPDSIINTNNHYITEKRAGCSRGGNDGTFVAAGHVGHGGDALLAQSRSLPGLAIVSIACRLTAGKGDGGHD